MLQTMIVSCRRSGLPARTGIADDAASPRAAGFPAFACCPWSLLILAKGSTAIDGRSDCGSAGLAISVTGGDLLGGCVRRSSATSDLVAASGSDRTSLWIEFPDTRENERKMATGFKALRGNSLCVRTAGRQLGPAATGG